MAYMIIIVIKVLEYKVFRGEIFLHLMCFFKYQEHSSFNFVWTFVIVYNSCVIF